MNNQESNRMTISEDVDERTRHEIYYPPFAAAVRAGVGSFMCSYNKINGKYSCENPETLKHDLKEVLNFTDGWVMSDWGATHSMSINEGLDQEMAGTIKPWMKKKLAAAVADGTVTMATLDETARRVLTPLFAVGEFDNPVSATGSITANVTSTLHNAIARNLSIASTVLLKNANGTLPINLDTGGRAGGAVRRIASLAKQPMLPLLRRVVAPDMLMGLTPFRFARYSQPHRVAGPTSWVSTGTTSGATCSFENGTDYYQLRAVDRSVVCCRVLPYVPQNPTVRSSVSAPKKRRVGSKQVTPAAKLMPTSLPVPRSHRVLSLLITWNLTVPPPLRRRALQTSLLSLARHRAAKAMTAKTWRSTMAPMS